MKHTAVIVLAVASVLFGSNAFAGTPSQSETRLLDQLEQDASDHYARLISELGQFRKFDDMPISDAMSRIRERVAWLYVRTERPDADYRFGYALAVYQWKAGDNNAAAVTLARADLWAFVDGQRCEDRTSPPSRIVPWRNAAQPVYSVIRAMPQEKKSGVRVAVEQEVARLEQRTPSPWMCSGGAMQITKILEKYPEIGAHDATKPFPQALLDKYPSVILVKGGRVELKDNAIQPDYISDEEWKKNLPQMVEAFKKSYFAALGIT